MSSSSARAPAPPAVTDATAASEAELREAASLLLGAPASAGCTFTRASGGVNNKCYYVETAGGGSFVLRIYNNGFRADRVVYEHAVLRALARTSAPSLPFALPTLVPAAGAASAAADDACMVALASGAHACLFVRAPGGGAALGAARAIGRATARLVAAMAALPAGAVPALCPNPQYRNLYASHHTTTRESVAAGMAGPACDAVRADVQYLLGAVAAAEAAIAAALAAPLPEQQIHADVHFDNVLVDARGEVTAILDFEFSSWDWRVMDLAVGLSKYAGLPGADAALDDWLAGYAEGGGALTAAEAALAPDLIAVRILSNVVYFCGRAMAGEDEWSCLTSRAAAYANRIRWLAEKKGWLVALLTDRLVPPAARD